jgi:serine-type D-Ala-D-Ala carboxypeptidase (penicillin-binding protein 5/6)
VDLKVSLRTAAVLSLLLFGWIGTAAAMPVPAAPNVAARSYLLMDYRSGSVLAEANADQRIEPASITKLMTEYVVFRELRAGNLQLTDEVSISERAWRTPGSRMFVEVGKRVPVEALLKGVIIQSGNDATVALAEHIAGSEETFAMLMNQHAARLGMTGTNFMNASGLPDSNHYMTARDIATLARALISEFPDLYQWHAQREYKFNDINQLNRNRLLWRDPSVDGLKTGHTSSAGYCLVASALRDDMRLISVVVGTSSEEARASESQALLNYGFRFFETHRLYEANRPLASPRIWKGATDTVPLGLQHDLYVTVPRGQYRQLKASLTLSEGMSAPAAKGQPFGTVNVVLGDEVLAEEPLLALDDVAEAGMLRRLTHSVLMLFN